MSLSHPNLPPRDPEGEVAPPAPPPPPGESPPTHSKRKRRWREDEDDDDAEGPPPPAEQRDESAGKAAVVDDLEDELEAEAEAEAEVVAERVSLSRRLLHGFGAMFLSMIVHMAVLILLAVYIMPEPIKQIARTLVVETLPPQEELQPDVIELEQEVQAATELSQVLFSSAPAAGISSGQIGSMAESVQLSQQMADRSPTSDQIAVTPPTLQIPAANKLVGIIPDGEMHGEPRAIVDDYAQALDRITQELVWMMDQGNVLVVWCFDQSESMKDDQEEIQQRIDRVYQELGLLGRDQKLLTTSVVSYGEKFNVLTAEPTGDVHEVRHAIRNIPIDDSGKEMMCQAIGAAVSGYVKYAKSTRRQMALILVTDESGERENNSQYLEACIAAANDAKCKVYVLGREAVFSYPYAFMRWKHPETGRNHWLRVDRGPETAFVEQLQTNGFRRRHDAFSSGYGSYEQTRIARETGGIFFMLPSVESSIVRGEKRRYELEAMRGYKPDWRSRMEVFVDRDKFPLRTLLWKIISDLNPYNPQSRDVVEVRTEFSPQLASLMKQADIERKQAFVVMKYMGAAQQELENNIELRLREVDPRWQANYDLMYAQLIAYQARLYEYGACLEDFMRNPQTVPMTKPPNLTLHDWHITTQKKTRTTESEPLIAQAEELFKNIIEEHPGTPWAARSEWERRRGYGVIFRPDYHPPYKPASGKIKIPKL